MRQVENARFGQQANSSRSAFKHFTLEQRLRRKKTDFVQTVSQQQEHTDANQFPNQDPVQRQT